MKIFLPNHVHHMPVIPLILLIQLALVLLDSAGAPAQPLTSLPLQELVSSSSLILVGTVTSIRVVAPENPYANYETVVRVEQALKGETSASITLRYPGPTTDLPDHGTAEVDNLPQYTLTTDTRHIFLLEGGAPLQLANLRQGILPIDMVEQVRGALGQTELAASLTVEQTSVQPAQTVQVMVHLRNVAGSR